MYYSESILNVKKNVYLHASMSDFTKSRYFELNIFILKLFGIDTLFVHTKRVSEIPMAHPKLNYMLYLLCVAAFLEKPYPNLI